MWSYPSSAVTQVLKLYEHGRSLFMTVDPNLAVPCYIASACINQLTVLRLLNTPFVGGVSSVSLDFQVLQYTPPGNLKRYELTGTWQSFYTFSASS